MKKNWRKTLLDLFLILLVIFVSIKEQDTWKLRILFIIQNFLLIEIVKYNSKLKEFLERACYQETTEEEKKVFAIHEAGHAIVAILLGFNVEEVTIKCKGRLGGYARYIEHYGKYMTRDFFIKKIQVLYAGKAAEEVILGLVTTTSGGDLKDATDMVMEMVSDYGMENLLIVKSKKYEEINSIVTEKQVDIAEKMCEECYSRTKMLIKANKELVQQLANVIIEKEEMTKEDIEQFKKEYNI